MTQPPDSFPSSPEPPGAFRRPGLLLAAGFLTVIVVLGVVVAVAGSGSESPDDSAPPVPASPLGAGGGKPLGCRPTDTSQQVPVSAPPGVTWELFQAIALPTSATAGPLVRQGGQRSCYARTPVGAMIASLQISARLTYSARWKAFLAHQVADGPGKVALARERERAGTSPPLPAGGVAQVAGFKFVTYGPDTAVVSLLTRLDPSTYVEGTFTVRWQAGDWRLELQPDGTPNAAGPKRSSLTGYVAWGGA